MRALLAGDWRVTGGVLKIARRIWEVGVAGWPVTGLDCGLPLLAFWQHNATQMQNVSEYMFVLALCLVNLGLTPITRLWLVSGRAEFLLGPGRHFSAHAHLYKQLLLRLGTHYTHQHDR